MDVRADDTGASGELQYHDDGENALMVLMRPLRKLTGAAAAGANHKTWATGTLTRTQEGDPRDVMFAKPKVAYIAPPPCGDSDCLSRAVKPDLVPAEGESSAPLYTLWLCPSCSRAAPCAFANGHVRRPQLFYTNCKPWGPNKRAAWTRSANTSILRAHLQTKR
jgi:hypothetical protein